MWRNGSGFVMPPTVQDYCLYFSSGYMGCERSRLMFLQCGVGLRGILRVAGPDGQIPPPRRCRYIQQAR
jgi:hypothetical protein